MRILVIDDKDVNLSAAKAQLKDHNLTVVDSYEAGEKMFRVEYDQTKVTKILSQSGIINRYPHGSDPEYWRAEQEAKQQSIIPFGFDVVLIDLLMPASGENQNEEGLRFVGQEMPIGIFLALLAAKRGAKYIAVFTDSDHHSHPASACFDAFNPNGANEPSSFTVEGAKVLLSNTRGWVNHFQPGNFTEEMDSEWDFKNKPFVRAKNWRKLLNYLMA